MTDRIKLIRSKLAELNPTHIDIVDNSHQHAGHASAQGGGHFDLTIVSPAFAQQSSLQRHRLVYTVLNDLMQHDIHALSISAYTPEEFSEK